MIAVFMVGMLHLSSANAAPTATVEAEPAPPSVDSIREKYWARGEESELGVVQNRAYTKSRRFEAGAFAGFATTDPFLNFRNLGMSLGFHFNEYLAAHLFGWKSMISPSGAYLAFQQNVQQQDGVPAVPYTNEPRWFLGSEASYSVLYGKLSVIGKAIIYYDFHLLGGLGVTGTESGRDLTPFIGIGQQVFLSRTATIRVDYRLMRYAETLLDKQTSQDVGATAMEGQPVGDRVNWTHAITVGVTFLMGGGA